MIVPSAEQIRERLKDYAYKATMLGSLCGGDVSLRNALLKFGEAFKQADTLLDTLSQELERLKGINGELCSSHNAILADGARWQTRAEQAELALTALREEREQLQDENQRLLTRTGEPVTLPSERATAPTDTKGERR